MIFVPFIAARKPRIYRKVIRNQTHVTGADCTVQVRVHFPMTEVVNPETLKINTLMEATYVFRLTVYLNKDEYESNCPELDEIACQKAKNTDRYKELMNDILHKEPDYREYEVEMYVLKDRLDHLKVHEHVEKFEEYVPV